MIENRVTVKMDSAGRVALITALEQTVVLDGLYVRPDASIGIAPSTAANWEPCCHTPTDMSQPAPE